MTVSKKILQQEKYLEKVLSIIDDADNMLRELYDDALKNGFEDLSEFIDEQSSALSEMNDSVMSHEIMEEAGNIREDENEGKKV